MCGRIRTSARVRKRNVQEWKVGKVGKHKSERKHEKM